MIQIHHIDDDPSNNDPRNLAVLCGECHDDTQISGGFSRKLDAEQVILYRDDWVALVRERRSRGIARSMDQFNDPDDHLQRTLALAERLRELEEYSQLARVYADVGQLDLRDKYADLALESDNTDANIVFVRGVQERPDLIPSDVAERRLAVQAKNEDWSQRARTLRDLGRDAEAAVDYVKSIKESLDDEGGTFSAAFYLKELVESGGIEALYWQAFAKAEAEDDLWWQVRVLQDLHLDDELDKLLLENAEKIEAEYPALMPLLLRVQGRGNEGFKLFLDSMGKSFVMTEEILERLSAGEPIADILASRREEETPSESSS